jgi:hypothetical protein
MFDVSIKLPPNFNEKFERIVTKKVNEVAKVIERNLENATIFMRDKVRQGYANSKLYGITTVPRRPKAKKVGFNRYHKSGGRVAALRRTGKMMNSVVVKRGKTQISIGKRRMEMTVGFRNPKYDEIAEYHSRGTGKYPQARDIWKAVYNRHRGEIVKIIRHGLT